MQIVNTYNKDVYNGDIGFMKSIDQINHKTIVSFDNRPVEPSLNRLEELQVAYAFREIKSKGEAFSKKANNNENK